MESTFSLLKLDTEQLAEIRKDLKYPSSETDDEVEIMWTYDLETLSNRLRDIKRHMGSLKLPDEFHVYRDRDGKYYEPRWEAITSLVYFLYDILDYARFLKPLELTNVIREVADTIEAITEKQKGELIKGGSCGITN